jgi:hypothetical protein
MQPIERSAIDRTLPDEHRPSNLLPVVPSLPAEEPPSTLGQPFTDSPQPTGDPVLPVSRREVLVLLTGALLYPASASALQEEPFTEDERLRQTLTLRVSRMPLAELFQRMGPVLDVRLVAESEDVGDQKVNLFVRDLPAAQILTAVANLFNAEGPRGYRWERSGRAARPRYVLVRDLASRQWQARKASEAETRLVSLLRDRIRALRSEPFTPGRAERWELPAMRKLLVTLSDAQIAQLASQRFLKLNALWESEPSALWKELSEQSLAAMRRHDPEEVQRRIETIEPGDIVRRTRAHIRLYGDPTRYLVRVAVSTPAGGEGMALLCQFSDPQAFSEQKAPPHVGPPDAPREPREPAFPLAPPGSWLMGDVLMELAARAGIQLIADDYTVDWSALGEIVGPQPLSSWLEAIRDQFGIAPAQDGPFLRLRNRRWWYERGEVPRRLLTRWVQLSAGTPGDRLQAAVEIARWAPLCSGSLPLYRLGLGRLAESPEMKELSTQFDDPEKEEMSPGLTEVAFHAQTELRIYALLSPAQQRAIRGEGLTLSWREMPSAARALFARSVETVWRPGVPVERLRRSSLWLRLHDDHVWGRYLIPGVPPEPEKWNRFIYQFDPARPVRAHSLVGERAPELHVEEPSGKRASLPPWGPLLLYLAPVWPRPIVIRTEEFADLRALQRLGADLPDGPERVRVIGTDATAAAVRDRWEELGLTLPPLALLPDLAKQLGVRHLPVAIIVDRGDRISWAKEGYTEGDEAEWRRRLDAATGS